MQLSQAFSDKDTRSQLAQDCAQLMDEQVSSKGGLGGLALKTAYGVVKGIGSDYIPGALRRLIPEALPALDPLWAEGEQTGDPVAYLSNQRDRTANAILSVTDARIQRTDNRAIAGVYNKLRTSIKTDVEAAVPGLAQILGKYA